MMVDADRFTTAPSFGFGALPPEVWELALEHYPRETATSPIGARLLIGGRVGIVAAYEPVERLFGVVLPSGERALLPESIVDAGVEALRLMLEGVRALKGVAQRASQGEMTIQHMAGDIQSQLKLVDALTAGACGADPPEAA